MKNYLYIPLGGNRVNSKLRLYFNLWFVFLASGLWHGASWSFVFWGAYHGFFLVAERIFLLKVYEKIGKLLSTLLTFILALTGWVFFRVEKLHDAFVYLKHMFIFNFSGASAGTFDSKFYTFLFIAAIFAFFAYFKRGQKIQDAIYVNEYTNVRHTVIAALSILLLVLSTASITSSGFNPFIYFRF